MKLRVCPVGPVEVPLPRYQTEGAAGMDLHAALREPVTIAPGERAMIPTGLSMAIPPGYEGQVRPRSGLAAKMGVTVLNAPGTIDSDYRGEVAVVLVNHGRSPAVIEPQMRVAQLVIAAFVRADVEAVSSLDDTARGAGGYGSTGA
ncbi:MAG: dUTP diphosphatase [Polyangiaceae bacterium]